MIYIKQGYYHIYNHGIDGNNIFFGPADYQYLLRLIHKYRSRYSVALIAYCLLPNHYHFLIQQQTDLPCYRFIQTLFNAYVQVINRKRRRRGTLFQGSAKCRWIKNERYLLHASRYIHGNPVKHGLVNTILAWEYSNYLEYVGMREGNLYHAPFLQYYFGSPQEYRKWVEQYLEGTLASDDLDDLQAL